MKPKTKTAVINRNARLIPVIIYTQRNIIARSQRCPRRIRPRTSVLTNIPVHYPFTVRSFRSSPAAARQRRRRRRRSYTVHASHAWEITGPESRVRAGRCTDGIPDRQTHHPSPGRDNSLFIYLFFFFRFTPCPRPIPLSERVYASRLF